MVGQSYLEKSAPPPSAAKRYFDQDVVPFAINAAAAVERFVAVIAQGVQRYPVPMVVIAARFGYALASGADRRRRR